MRTRGQVIDALAEALALAAQDAHQEHQERLYVANWQACPWARCVNRIALIREAYDLQRSIARSMSRRA
jgi:hypothetical protein